MSICENSKILTESFRCPEEIIQNVNKMLNKLTGTHNFHNFTSGRKYTDPSANRYILTFEVSCCDRVKNRCPTYCEVLRVSIDHLIRFWSAASRFSKTATSSSWFALEVRALCCIKYAKWSAWRSPWCADSPPTTRWISAGRPTRWICFEIWDFVLFIFWLENDYRKVLQSAPVLCTEFCYCTTLIAPPKIDWNFVRRIVLSFQNFQKSFAWLLHQGALCKTLRYVHILMKTNKTGRCAKGASAGPNAGQTPLWQIQSQVRCRRHTQVAWVDRAERRDRELQARAHILQHHSKRDRAEIVTKTLNIRIRNRT